jgi:hypothetical protein
MIPIKIVLTTDAKGNVKAPFVGRDADAAEKAFAKVRDDTKFERVDLLWEVDPIKTTRPAADERQAKERAAAAKARAEAEAKAAAEAQAARIKALKAELAELEPAKS